jgi:poly-gamma-glutamate capsule biosynthesis protein CapA/YwtB (metallophosphatase superfamily)
VAEDDVDIVTLEDSEITPVALEPPRKSPKERKKKRQKRAAQRDEHGRLVIRLTADTAEDEGRPNQTTDNFGARTVHSTEDSAVLATDVASVEIMATSV